METIQSDADLIRLYFDGDENALKLLVKKHFKSVYNFLYQYVSDAQDAEDLTQDVFVKVWKNLKKFDPEKSLKTWIFSIAKNSAIDLLKKKKVKPFSTMEDEGEEGAMIESIIDTEPFPDELMRRSDIAKILNRAVRKLPTLYRIVLFLYYRDGLNFREIAESLGESIDTVKSRHRRAITMLRKKLQNEGGQLSHP